MQPVSRMGSSQVGNNIYFAVKKVFADGKLAIFVPWQFLYFGFAEKFSNTLEFQGKRQVGAVPAQIFHFFNLAVEKGSNIFLRLERILLHHKKFVFLVYVLLVAGTYLGLQKMPTSFLPVE